MAKPTAQQEIRTIDAQIKCHRESIALLEKEQGKHHFGAILEILGIAVGDQVRMTSRYGSTATYTASKGKKPGVKLTITTPTRGMHDEEYISYETLAKGLYNGEFYDKIEAVK